MKNALFKIFIFSSIQAICFITFVIISGITGSFDWPIERQTSSIAGIIIQIINLIVLIDGMIIAIYVIIFIILIVKG
ncbi:MAG: hypothetical protein EAX89_17275 [Candidatus Lokiarchaeota archaeon]|nr:hypothetical protein [Candidatus Lokiarchaeota archaeon]